MLRATQLPRDIVCAVPYSQFIKVVTSSWHWLRGGCPESIAQKDVTALLAVSRRPASALAGALCSSVRVQTCEPGKFVLQVALAPGRPSVAL